MNIGLSRIPVFYDIAPNQLWIPFTVSAFAYLFKNIIPKVFSRHEDSMPFAKLRTRIRLFVDSYASISQRKYRIIFISIPESLFLSIFIFSVLLLKKSTSIFTFKDNPQAFMFMVVPCCCLFAGTLSLFRDIIAVGLYSISIRIQDPYPFLATYLKKAAQFIATYEHRWRFR